MTLFPTVGTFFTGDSPPGREPSGGSARLICCNWPSWNDPTGLHKETCLHMSFYVFQFCLFNHLPSSCHLLPSGGLRHWKVSLAGWMSCVGKRAPHKQGSTSSPYVCIGLYSQVQPHCFIATTPHATNPSQTWSKPSCPPNDVQRYWTDVLSSLLNAFTFQDFQIWEELNNESTVLTHV